MSTENYVLRFKLAETLAAACCEDGSFVERQHILHYLYDPDVNYAELGAYTLGHLYVAQPAEIDLAVLAKLQTDPHSYALRQVFGAILLNLALRRRVRRGSDNRLIVDVSAGPDPERISEAIDPRARLSSIVRARSGRPNGSICGSIWPISTRQFPTFLAAKEA